MAYNENLGRRVAHILAERGADFTEKKMFGGLGFMLNDKMCCGIVKEDLMLRVMDEHFERLLHEPHARPMEFTGRVMKGFLFIDNEGVESDAALARWLDFGLEFAEKGEVKSKKKK